MKDGLKVSKWYPAVTDVIWHFDDDYATTNHVIQYIGIPAVVLSTLIKLIEVLQALIKYFINLLFYYLLFTKAEESA